MVGSTDAKIAGGSTTSVDKARLQATAKVKCLVNGIIASFEVDFGFVFRI